MRNLVFSVATLTALALCACGASSKEVAMAKTARYQGDKLAMFADAKAAVESKYKVLKSDETTLGLQTEPRWFTPEGLAGNDSGDVSMLPDKSINFAMVVQMFPDGDAYIAKVTPVMSRYNKGIPKPEQIKEGDASLPGWVEDKTNSLALDVHKALAKYELKTVPGQAPPPSPAAAPAPEGSAAPAP